MSRTAILYVTERCNQACVFCLEEDGAPLRPDLPPEQVAADLRALRERGAEHITFMGGETFLRKDLPVLLAQARALGFTRLGVTTNGTALAHPGFLARMIEAGLDFVEISVHADGAGLAEAISGKGFTFERQERALAELAAERARIDVIVNVVICRENAARIAEVVGGLLDRHPALRPRVKLKFVSVIGAAATAREPPLRYREVELAPTFAILRERGADYWLYNLPLCRAPGEAARSHEAQAFVLDWRYHDFDHRTRQGYYDSGFQLEGNVWPEASCAGCTLAPLCPGIEESYRRSHGEDELRAQSDAPLPCVAEILARAGRDPAAAAAVLARLSDRPRPAHFRAAPQPRQGEAILTFAHPDWTEPLHFELAPADPTRPSFAAGARLRLSYRRPEREPGTDPAGAALLEALACGLAEADAAGDPLASAAERLAGAAVARWSCSAVRFGPTPPDPTAPLSIRVPAR